MEQKIISKTFKVEQKTFYFDLKENLNGRFLRITEASGKRSSIIIPDTGFEEFVGIISSMTNNKNDN